MWDTVVDSTGGAESAGPLSHEMPCQQCGHASHTFLPCSDRCDCAAGRELRAIA